MKNFTQMLKRTRPVALWSALAFFALGQPTPIHAQSFLKTFTIELGPFAALVPQTVIDLQAYGIPVTQVVGLSAVIRSDLGEVYQISRMPDIRPPADAPGGSVRIDYDPDLNRLALIVKADNSYFDNAANRSRFDDPAINRGSVTIRYLSNTPAAAMPQDNSLFFRIGSWSITNDFGKSVAIPGLGMATSSIVEFQTTIYSNPSGSQIEAEPLRRPSGSLTTGKRDRGGREHIAAAKKLELYVPNLPAGRTPDLGNAYPGNGRFVASAYSGTSNNRGWAMVRHNQTVNNSNLSQPFAVLTKTLSMGPWNATNATSPLAKSLSSLGVAADRVLYTEALVISDVNPFTPGYKDYRDYHGLNWGGSATVISGIQDKILFHSNPNKFGAGNFSGTTDNRGFMSIFHRAADCADGTGSVLTGATNVGGRFLTAMTWNGSAYVSTANYTGCHGQRNGIYVLENTGNDIWNNADQFRFAYKTTSGSRPVTVKVEQLENTDGWARAGLMIREGTANNAKYAGIFVTPGNGVIFQARSSTGNNTVDLGRTTGLKAPIWLRLYYSGSSVSAGYSSDGITFNPLGGAYSISFGTYNMGLAAAGRSNYPNTSVYSNFQ